jgi:hypothetical protein
MVTGLNTDIKHRGRTYHVQTQHVQRAEPAAETLIYEGGAVVVRMTVLLGDLARQFEFSGDDINHLLDLQHWNLVRKVQYGMLDGDGSDAPADAGAPPDLAASNPADAGVTDDISEFDDSEVHELHSLLDDRLGAPSEPAKTRPPQRPRPRRAPVRPAPRRAAITTPSWRRKVLGWIGAR